MKRCVTCGNPIEGRHHRLYCSGACVPKRNTKRDRMPGPVFCRQCDAEMQHRSAKGLCLFCVDANALGVPS